MPSEAEIEAAMKSLLSDSFDLHMDERGCYRADDWRAAARKALEAAEEARIDRGAA